MTRLLAVPAVAAVLVAGVWVAGGVVTNDYRASMALTAAWFGIAGAGCLALALRRRALRAPVLGTYVLVAGAVGGYLALTTLRDRVVDERVVTGVPAGTAAVDAAGGTDSGDARAARPRPANVELARGRFRSGEHATTGRAAVVRVRDGRRYLTLTAFETSAGPDLRVRLVPGDTFDGGADGAVDLGGLKGNRGDQQYRLPGGTQIAG
ncbi:MAG TPA: DM13 domain-containing protein, partial [Solirubrobacteraceae bacterium]|nr:DM13 domain-containing protein [Solirubrobacteraceae bacterium]